MSGSELLLEMTLKWQPPQPPRAHVNLWDGFQVVDLAAGWLVMQQWYPCWNPQFFTSSYPVLANHSDIYSDTLSGGLSDILFWRSIWHLFWHSVWPSFWHSLWHVFESRRTPQHLKLAIWCPALTPQCSRRRGVKAASQKEGQGRNEGRKEGRKGVAPLLKSRDPHLAGGEKE